MFQYIFVVLFLTIVFYLIPFLKIISEWYSAFGLLLIYFVFLYWVLFFNISSISSSTRQSRWVSFSRRWQDVPITGILWRQTLCYYVPCLVFFVYLLPVSQAILWVHWRHQHTCGHKMTYNIGRNIILTCWDNDIAPGVEMVFDIDSNTIMNIKAI